MFILSVQFMYEVQELKDNPHQSSFKRNHTQPSL